MTSVYSDAQPIRATTSALKFSMSAADRWFHCPGSAWVSAVLRGSSSWYARQGTCAHKVLEHILKYPEFARCDEKGFIGQEWATEPEPSKETFVVDQEMFDQAFAARDTLTNAFGFMTDKTFVGRTIGLERFVKYDNEGLISRGRTDISVIDDSFLATVDYKYGVGFIVEPIGNLQTGSNLVAMRQEHGRRELYYSGILQPRGRGAHPERIRWWIMNNDQLDKFEANMAAAMDRARLYPVPYHNGAWCKWCPGKGLCPAWSMDLMQSLFFSKAKPESANLWVLEHAAKIESYLAQIEKDTKALLEAGGTVPGWALDKRPGNRKWVEGVTDDLVVRAVETGLAKNDVVKTVEKVIGIVEAEKLGIRTKGLTTKPDTVKLVKSENVKNGINDETGNGFGKVTMK